MYKDDKSTNKASLRKTRPVEVYFFDDWKWGHFQPKIFRVLSARFQCFDRHIEEHSLPVKTVYRDWVKYPCNKEKFAIQNEDEFNTRLPRSQNPTGRSRPV